MKFDIYLNIHSDYFEIYDENGQELTKEEAKKIHPLFGDMLDSLATCNETYWRLIKLSEISQKINDTEGHYCIKNDTKTEFTLHHSNTKYQGHTSTDSEAYHLDSIEHLIEFVILQNGELDLDLNKEGNGFSLSSIGRRYRDLKSDSIFVTKEQAEKIHPIFGQLLGATTKEQIIAALTELNKISEQSPVYIREFPFSRDRLFQPTYTSKNYEGY